MTKRRLLSWGPLFALGLLSGCADQTFEGNPDDDKDGDGYVADADCDDKNASVNPAAAEQVNCIDDNCNGKIDEGSSNEDKDGDGYCPSTGDSGICEGNKSRHPGQSEDGGDGSKKPNGIDDDCDGKIDEDLPTSDMDKDGFNSGDGDCNDDDPNINPGAIEVEGLICKTGTDCPNTKCYGGYCRCTADADCGSGKTCTKNADCTVPGETCVSNKCASPWRCENTSTGMEFPNLKVCRDNADNDCDGKKDEMPTVCDDLTKLKQTDAIDYARAIELCDVDKSCGVDNKCPGSLKCVGGKCTRVTYAAFNADADTRARAIDKEFAQGGPMKPRKGSSFAILSSGLAKYDPKTTCPQSGTTFTNSTTDPDPTATDKTANDYVHLELHILVPTNAQSFEFDFHFFSTEYPEYVGTQFNDTFWVQLESKKFKGNISFDKNGTAIRINNSFFDICDPYPSKPQTLTMCTQPSSLLTGTGYAKDCTYSYGEAMGGSTGWLRTVSPVTPGETIKLIFSIFDKGDHILDSSVLLDNFRWKLAPAAKPSTGPD